MRDTLGRHATATIVSLGGVLLVAYLAATLLFPKPSGRVIIGDATHHFVQLRSLVFDRDVSFLNEHMHIYGFADTAEERDRLLADVGTPTGLVRNYMPIGPAILWAPLYLLVVGLERVMLGPGVDGFSRAAQLAPGVTGILAATAGTWLTWRLCRRETSDSSAIIATAAAWLGTHALYYSLVSPAYSHAASMLSSALFFGYWIRSRGELPSIATAAVWGALVGVAALMRWQDAVFAVAPLVDIVRWRTPMRTRLTAAAAMTAAALVVFSPQLLVWKALYGQAFAVPQGASFMQWSSPHLLAVLFSDNHGLFTWAPLLLVGAAGLVACLGRRADLALPVTLVVLASWYVNASVADWWAGEAFGARRFLSLFPLFAMGLATWLHAVERSPRALGWRCALLGVLTGANWLLLLQYQLFMKGLAAIAPYPAGVFDMWLARFLVPFRLLGW